MEDQIKTNIGKIFTKYNKDTDSFDMIRIVHNNDENIFYRKLDANYKFAQNGIDVLKINEFKETFKDWDVLSPDGILSLTNVVVTETENGSPIRDIIMMFFIRDNTTHTFNPQKPCVIARQAINNIYKMAFDDHADDVGVSVTEDCMPPEYTFEDFTAAEKCINSYLTCVYKIDTPKTLAAILNNETTTDILHTLYQSAIDYDKNTIINFNKAIEDDCYRGYCNTLSAFIGNSGLIIDIYSKLGIVKVDFELKSNEPINDENKVFLSMLYGGITIVKAIPLKFGFDINLSCIKMKYMLVMDSTSTLWIVPFTSTKDEFSPVEFYKITAEQTNKIQERLNKCIESYDAVQNNT